MKICPFVMVPEKEIFKTIDIQNIRPNYYEISNLGNVKIKHSGKIMKLHSNGNYLSVGLQNIYGNTTHFLIHRLVAIYFILLNGNFDDYQVNHMVPNGKINHMNNLEWVTPKFNMQYSVFINTTPIGESCYNSRITEDQAHIICNLLQNPENTYSYILSIIGMDDSEKNRALIGNIKYKKSWKHVSSKYNIPEFSRFMYNDRNIVYSICNSLSNGKSIYDIVEEYGYNNCIERKRFYERVRRIKNREIWTDISKNYDF